MKCLEVAVAAPIYHTLTYLPPVESDSDLIPGVRLLVPLGSRLVTGYLLDAQLASNQHFTGQLKPVADVLDVEPLFPTELVSFFRWIAEYYHYPIGQVIHGGLPSGLTVKSGQRLELTEEGKIILGKGDLLDSPEKNWIRKLFDKGFLTPAATRRAWHSKDRKQISGLIKKGVLEMNQSLSKSRVAVKTETFVIPEFLHKKINILQIESSVLKPSEIKTLEVLQELIEEQEETEIYAVPKTKLTGAYPSAGRVLKGLAEKDLITLVDKPVYRDPFGRITSYVAAPERLTVEQEKALARIIPAITKREFETFLLHGVTGSGKTEIYLRAASATIQQKSSVLVLVPEIALATQLETHFLSRFGEQVALLHSGLSQGEFYDQWRKININKAKIVIGARSAVFAPLKDIGLIIVDEEHDSAYKQEDGLRYQARDLAILRGSKNKSIVILGSATPSVTSKYNAEKGKYKLLQLQKRIAERPLPSVEIIDLRQIKTVSGHPPLFSNRLITSLKENIAKGQQSLIFLNRRGFANLVLCNDCGQNLQCKNCQVTLTLHKKSKVLLCHYCGFSIRSAALCPNCQSANVIEVGYGTERVEDELSTMLPQAKLARLDRDTCNKRRDYLTILKKMHDGQIDILVGTQMIAKGHHFPNVTLVGIIWADAGLGVPDFRSSERTFQLLSQVSGRAGRGVAAGRVIVQTHQPDHYSISLAQKHDYQGLYEKEIALRKALQYPPFSRIIYFRLAGDSEKEVRDAALQFAKVANLIKGDAKSLKILGPVPAPLARLRNKYRWQVLLMGSNRSYLHSVSATLLKKTQGMEPFKKVKVSIDVDPENLL